MQRSGCFVMEQQTFIEKKCQEELPVVMINEDEKH